MCEERRSNQSAKNESRYLWSKCAIKRSDGVLWRSVLAVAMLLALAAQVERAEALKNTKVKYMWDFYPIVFDSDQQRQQLQDNGVYSPGDTVMFDMDYDAPRNRTFVGLPHFLPGSAVTLATIENSNSSYNARLLPYPNMTWHGQLNNCDGITSVFRIEIDKCGRLWVLDSGILGSFSVFTPVCQPQLLIFNLTNDKLILRRRFNSSEVANAFTLWINLITEQKDGECSDDVYAYFSDASQCVVYVFHLATLRLWRVPSDFFYPDVNNNFDVGGYRFTRMIGVLGLALTPYLEGQTNRDLYFQSFSGYLLGKVSTDKLHNSSLFGNGALGIRPYVEVVGQRFWPSAAAAMSRRGILFFGQIGAYSLNCWNMKMAYSPTNIGTVDYDVKRIRIQMGVKIITNADEEEEVWMVSNNVQGVFAYDFTPNNTYPNYIIWGKVDDLIKGTVCDRD